MWRPNAAVWNRRKEPNPWKKPSKCRKNRWFCRRKPLLCPPKPVGEAEQPAPEEPTLSHTAALERELEQLRQEKLRRQLMDEASAQLTERGIDPAFAPFVLGETSADTRKRVEQFDRQFAAALRRHLAARLPAGEPRDFSVSRPAPRRRGIRKLN